MNIIKAIIFGIVEGLTEWMPVSSTAHMDILNKLLPLDVSSEFYEVFEVVIQLGAILALLLIFFNKVFPFGKSKRPLGTGILAYVKKDKFILWLKIIIACLPAIIYELLLEDHFNFVTSENKMTIIGIALILVGFVFIVVEALLKDKEFYITSTRKLSYSQALIIGLAQLAAAIFPGVSRSGATIIAMLLLGISRTTAVEFTFELAIPVMAGASLMKLLKHAAVLSAGNVTLLLVGCISAFIVSIFMIKYILDYIKKNNFNIFGFYRILLGIIVLSMLR